MVMVLLNTCVLAPSMTLQFQTADTVGFPVVDPVRENEQVVVVLVLAVIDVSPDTYCQR